MIIMVSIMIEKRKVLLSIRGITGSPVGRNTELESKKAKKIIYLKLEINILSRILKKASSKFLGDFLFFNNFPSTSRCSHHLLKYTSSLIV